MKAGVAGKAYSRAALATVRAVPPTAYEYDVLLRSERCSNEELFRFN